MSEYTFSTKHIGLGVTSNHIQFYWFSTLFLSEGRDTGPHSWGRMFRFSGERGIPCTINIVASLGGGGGGGVICLFVCLQSPLKLLNKHGKSIMGLIAKFWLKEVLCNISNRNNMKSIMPISSLKEGSYWMRLKSDILHIQIRQNDKDTYFRKSNSSAVLYEEAF